MRTTIARCLPLLLTFTAVVAVTGLSAQEHSALVAYRLQTTGDVRLTVPTSANPSAVIFRDARDKWQPADVQVTDGVMQVKLQADQLKSGRTILVLQVPSHVNLDDKEPPEVIAFTVDGRNYGPVRRVALGGVEFAPRHMSVEVADKLNSLRTRTLRVMVNSRPYRLRDAGISFERYGPRHGLISVELDKLMGDMRAENNISVIIDDYGLTDGPLQCTLSFAHAPEHRLDDGTVLSVDSVTSASGWDEWWVIADGEKMDQTSGSTAGKTWLSQENGEPHWVRMTFPEPREVSGIRLWWAFYETYRTSVAYEIQSWDGEKWVSLDKITGQTDRQCSEHTFEPVTTTAIRVWQPSLSGHPGRAEYMWLSEFEVF